MLKCFLISGRVQGVGFRFWTLRRVSEIGGISGYVCNLSGGDVLVLTEGAEEKLRPLSVLRIRPWRCSEKSQSIPSRR